MYLKEIKEVKLFKYVNEGSGQVNIYVEPTGERSGRLIICTAYKIFQRYFDGAGGGIYSFLTKMGIDEIPYIFEGESEEIQRYISKNIKDVWPLFQQEIKVLKV